MELWISIWLCRAEMRRSTRHTWHLGTIPDYIESAGHLGCCDRTVDLHICYSVDLDIVRTLRSEVRSEEA
jgi:hypothetical protein